MKKILLVILTIFFNIQIKAQCFVYHLFPNPNNGSFTIILAPCDTNMYNKNIHVIITSQKGNVIKKLNTVIGPEDIKVNLSNYSDGIYYVKIFTDIKYSMTLTLVKLE
jgi:hypothetical protein